MNGDTGCNFFWENGYFLNYFALEYEHIIILSYIAHLLSFFFENKRLTKYLNILF